jgi:folylpolyglutamate synthase
MDVRERILINNEKISKPVFSYYVFKLHTEIHSVTRRLGLKAPPIPGYPGFLALLAIYIFFMEKVDVAILETGIGGERDSTNIFPHPAATGITSVGLDHVNILGHSVEEIAWHKAGIFKPGSPAFTVVQDEAILQVLQRRAVEKNVSGGLQVITDQKALEYNVKVIPNMRYQRLNASLAISLADSYLKSTNMDFSLTSNITCSLQDTKLLGRCQVSKDNDNTWFISIAHNEDSLKETVSWFKEIVQQPK